MSKRNNNGSFLDRLDTKFFALLNYIWETVLLIFSITVFFVFLNIFLFLLYFYTSVEMHNPGFYFSWRDWKGLFVFEAFMGLIILIYFMVKVKE